MKCHSNHTVIGPAVISSSYGSCDIYVSSVSGSDNRVVDQVPRSEARVDPRGFMLDLQTKERVGDR